MVAPLAKCAKSRAAAPGIVADVEWFSLRRSSVQMAPALLQLVVSGSVMLTDPVPLGWTVTVQFWLLPLVLRCAFKPPAPAYATEFARVSVWIGEIQWVRRAARYSTRPSQGPSSMA